MTKREFLRQEVLKFVQHDLAQYGYKLNKRQTEFTKKNKAGWVKFYLNFLLLDEGLDINPMMLIRFNVVEDIFHKTSGFESKYQKTTSTIGSSVEEYLQTGYGSYHLLLKEEEEINETAHQIVNIFKKIALPFYEKFDSLNAIEEKINNDSKGGPIIGAIFKGSKGIILAKLLGRLNFQDLQLTYMNYYEQFANGFYLPSYLALIEYLKSR